MKQTKSYQEMNEAEQTILDYLQQAEYRRNNSKDYVPIDGIEILREIAEKLNLIQKNPLRYHNGGGGKLI